MAKKKKNKKAYLNDFKIDLNGNYSYDGKYRFFSGEEQDKKRILTRLKLFSIALGIVIIGSGFLPGAGITNSFYVIIPYLVEVGSAGATIWAIIELLGAERREHKIREYIYEKTVGKIPNRTMVILLAAGAGMAGNLVYLILHGLEGKPLPTIGYILSRGIVIGIVLAMRKETKKMMYGESKSYKEESSLKDIV